VDAGDATGFESFGEDFVEFIGAAFGASEDDDLAGFFAGEDANEEWKFAIFIDGDVELFDGINDDAIFREIDGLWIDHVFLGESQDVRGHGGGEQECLSIGGAAAEDAFDIRSEADIEHTIGFVEYCDGEIFEVEVSAAHEINDATGCSNDDLGTILDVVDLATDGAASDGESESHFESSGQFLGFAADLFAEFAGGSENEHLDGALEVIDLFEGWEHKGSGFAGACAGLSDTVAAGESEWDESSLDGAGEFVSNFVEGAESGG
jgi:hypothetical protein